MVYKKIGMSWSGGKDAAYALHLLKQTPGYEIKHLMVTVYEGSYKSAMHQLDSRLLDAQAESMDMNLLKMVVPVMPDNAAYSRAWRNAIASAQAMGIEALAFGDIFLEDLKMWRENQLNAMAMKALFPLWKMSSGQIAQAFLDQGFEAVVVCVDTRVLIPDFCGRLYDASFINDLPKGVDPCGENGEFHTFCFNGPLFSTPVPFTRGDFFQLPFQDPLHPNESVFFQYLNLLPG
jgi:uncharacterized protein (TIGR00290 family)